MMHSLFFGVAVAAMTLSAAAAATQPQGICNESESDSTIYLQLKAKKTIDAEAGVGQELEPAFVKGTFGSKKCPVDSVALEKHECKAFANGADGIAWKGTLKKKRKKSPAGCFLKGKGSKKKAFFNEHPSGGRNQNARPICKQPPPTVTPPRPTPPPTPPPTPYPSPNPPAECLTKNFKKPCIFPFKVFGKNKEVYTYNTCQSKYEPDVGPGGYYSDGENTWCATETKEHKYWWEVSDWYYYYANHAGKYVVKDFATEKDYCSPECPGYRTPAPTPPGLWDSLSEVARSVADRPVGSFREPGA